MTVWRVATLPQVTSRNPATTGESQPCLKWRVATLPQFASRNPACYGCFCRVCVVTYPYVHHACSLLPLDPCSSRCGGGCFGCGGTHSGGRPSGRGGAAALRGAPTPTEPRALAVGFGLGTNTHSSSMGIGSSTRIGADEGRAFACAGAYLGATGLDCACMGALGDDLTCTMWRVATLPQVASRNPATRNSTTNAQLTMLDFV